MKKIKLNNHFTKSSFRTIKIPLLFLLSFPIFRIQCSIIKREALFQTGLFNDNLTIFEDWDLMLRLSLHGSLGICNHVLVNIYKREEQIDNLAKQLINKPIYRYKTCISIYKNLLTNNKLLPIERKGIKRTLNSIRRGLGNEIMKSGQKTEAQKIFRQAVIDHLSIKSFIKYCLTFLPLKVALLFIKKIKIISFNIKITQKK